MSPQEREAKTLEYYAFLEDAPVMESLDTIEAQFVTEWKSCQDGHERDNLWRTVRIIGMLKQQMRSIASGASVTSIRRIK